VCLISAAAGVAGTNLDSLYGAVLENRGVFGNSGTNLLATLSGGLVAAGLYAVFIFVL
ncbi:MAG TPA: TIGR00297 family protein, partial [Methanocorpusculum sp.]|nr:TIGR00297 family protein [Methanocorpusculum sp.]